MAQNKTRIEDQLEEFCFQSPVHSWRTDERASGGEGYAEIIENNILLEALYKFI